MKRVDLAGLAMEASSGAPLVLLREHDAPHRVLPIFVGGPEAAAIALAVTGHVPPRPLTHDLMAALVRSLDGHLDSVEVTGLNSGTFAARMTVHGADGAEQHIDTRPSDAIALAIRLRAPLFVSDDVLDEAASVPDEATGQDDDLVVDEGAIDDAVDEFRAFLDDIDPDDFTDST